MPSSENILFIFFKKLFQPLTWFVKLNLKKKFKVLTITVFTTAIFGFLVLFGGFLVDFSDFSGFFGFFLDFSGFSKLLLYFSDF